MYIPKIKKSFILIIILILIVFLILFLRSDEDTWICQDGQWIKHGHPQASQPNTGCELEPVLEIKNFTDCLTAGYPIMETYPRQCYDQQDNLFLEEIGMGQGNIILDYPQPEQVISSPLEIRGQARGTWYFEADFLVILTNWDGLIIAQGIAQAQGDWMTEDFVPFQVILEFQSDTSVSNRGSLILQKDNPSGLPEYDDALEITVFFE